MKFKIKSRVHGEQFIEFDDENLELLQDYRWYVVKPTGKTLYAITHDPINNKKFIFMHHLIIGKPEKGYSVDHIDANGLNNKKENLQFLKIGLNLAKGRMLNYKPGAMNEVVSA